MKSQLNKKNNHKVVNYQFLISQPSLKLWPTGNFYSISNVLMFQFLKRVVVMFRNSSIENLLEIRNLKLKIGGLIKSVLSSGVELTYESSLA